jgi:hypothetical protein
MYIQFNVFNLVTIFVMALTVVLAYKRFTMRLDSNGPLAYYAVLVGYMRTYEPGLDHYWVFAGVICGLLLRFEFLGKVADKIVRAFELVVLGYVFWRSLGKVLLWW